MTVIPYPIRNSPREKFNLSTNDGHTLNIVEYGNPSGYPLLYLHGGPGAGHNPNWQKYFDPDFYRMIFFDQRGCGESTPTASTENNTMQHLIDDIEMIRNHLKISRWVVGGRSFGSTLALEYAKQHHEKISHLLPASIFFGDKDGANHIGEEGGATPFDQRYLDSYRDFVPTNKRADGLIAYYDHIMKHGIEDERIEAAKRFMMWDCSIGGGSLDESMPSVLAVEQDPALEIPITTLFMHYSRGEFLGRPSDVMFNNEGLAKIPMTIVHGEKDRITPVENARRLKEAYGQAILHVCPDAGHNGMHPKYVATMVEISDGLKQQLSLER